MGETDLTKAARIKHPADGTKQTTEKHAFTLDLASFPFTAGYNVNVSIKKRR